jgi:phosphohistidine phosphatase
MKTLFILRHAKSSWKDAHTKDFDRPLNERGKRNAPFMGELLYGFNERLDGMVSSPAKRALATSCLFAKTMHFPLEKITQHPEIYEASLQDLIDIILSFNDDQQVVALVGHNPGLTQLSNYLTDHYIDNIPTAGVVKITFDIESWQEIIRGIGSIEYFHYPRAYEDC